MDIVNTPNNIVFNPADGDPGPSRQVTQQRNIAENIDTALGEDYTAAVKAALQLEDANTAAVEEAKKAVLGNALDTPTNIADAARNILKFGI